MPIRLSGINSGLDTDAIVKELVNAYSLKTQKYEKEQTKLEWKQDAWKDLNTKIYSLYTNVSNLRYSSAYSLKRTTVSDATKATVTASSEAVTGTQTLNILNTAQAGYLTGGKLGADIKASSTLADLGYNGEDTSIKLTQKDGKETEIKITKDTKISELITSLQEAGVNANFDANNKRIFISAKETGSAADFNLTADNASGSEVLSALGLNTALVDANGNFINGAEKYTEAYAIYKEAQKAGMSVEDYLNARVNEYKDNQETIDNYNKLQEQLEARTAHNDIYAALQKAGLADRDAGDGTRTGIKSGELRDMVKELYSDGELTEEEVSNYITEKGITGADATEVYNVLSGQTENMAKSAEYTSKYNDLISESPAELKSAIAAAEADYNAAVEANENNKYAHLVDDEDALQALVEETAEAVKIMNSDSARNGAAVKIAGGDAEITLNGVSYTSSSNTFIINGITIEATGVTGAGVDNAITINTTVDTQGIYDKIKDFLTEYNNVVNEMAKLYNAESAKDYEPLTDEEKDAMSEEQIEKWEAKIKSALLRRDSSLDGIMSAMVNSMAQSIEVNGEKLSLSNFGIQTLGYLNAAENEHYAYHIDGDEDDSNTSGKKDKLMAAIQEDPDKICEFMKKLASNLYTSIDNKMKSTELSSAYKVYNDKELDSQLDDYADMIEKWEDKVAEQEEYYYDKFSQMEVALSKLNSQTSTLSGLFGTA